MVPVRYLYDINSAVEVRQNYFFLPLKNKYSLEKYRRHLWGNKKKYYEGMSYYHAIHWQERLEVRFSYRGGELTVKGPLIEILVSYIFMFWCVYL